MNELIYKDDAMQAVRNAYWMRLEKGPEASYVADSVTSDAIRNIAELDPVQRKVVRCAHCKKYDTHNHKCKWWNHGVSNVDWCSYAEERQ